MSKPKNRTFFAAINADDFERVALLIAAGADVGALFGPARLPPALHAAAEGHARSLRALLAAGADIDQTDRFGNTALMLASGHGRVECVRALIEWGADLNKPDDRGIAPLHFAAYKDAASCLRALIAAGADVDQLDVNGSTPGIFACRTGQGDSLRLLIAAGADLTLVDRFGLTARDYANREAALGDRACASLLIAHELLEAARVERAAIECCARAANPSSSLRALSL